MMKISSIDSRLIKKKLITLLFVGVSVASFAISGTNSGRDRKPASSKTILSSRTPSVSRGFSLKSTYNYRSNNLFNLTTNNRYIMVNTVVTYQKGNGTYIMPLKKKVFMDKVKINNTPVRF